MNSNETKHTPLQFSENCIELWRDGKTVAKMGYGDSVIPRFPSEIEEQKQNGRDLRDAYNATFAAGLKPDKLKRDRDALLEALRKTASWIGCNVFPPNTYHIEELRRIHAAIAQAESEDNGK